jgi:hypothetical protein
MTDHLTPTEPMLCRTWERNVLRRAATLGLLLSGVALGSCAQLSDNVSGAFVDPAKYDLYNCAQLRTARTENAKRVADLKGLMAKAETGAAGPVVAEVAYGNDYLSARAQGKLADEVWARNHCDSAALPPENPPPPAAPATEARKRKP